jgi:predicted NAD/FAD-binding protein
VDLDGKRLAADTGFMVFNHRTYPNLIHLFEYLGIEEQDADMSFSVQHLSDRIEWKGDLGGLFAQPGNLVRPAFWEMLREVFRFSRNANRLLADPGIDSLTLGELLAREGYGRPFVDWYLVPMGAAIWSTPVGRMLDFPAGTFLRFCDTHGLLHVTGKPQWKSVPGGARRYTHALAERVSGRVRTGARVACVQRFDDRVEIGLENGESLTYDGVVLACHSNEALGMLADPDDNERSVLSAVPYQTNDVVLHTDRALLPRHRHAWAAWNYVSDGHGDAPVAVHYQLNVLQRHDVPSRLLVSLNSVRPIAEDQVIRRFEAAHPQFTAEGIAAQKRIGTIQGVRRTWYAGAWQRYGFHEDGCLSGLNVAGLFGIAPPWGRILDPEKDGERA